MYNVNSCSLMLKNVYAVMLYHYDLLRAQNDIFSKGLSRHKVPFQSRVGNSITLSEMMRKEPIRRFF